MRVEALWRYPVKSLGGERLAEAALTSDGVAGDRLVHVRRASGVLTGRTRHGLVTVPASTGADGEPLVSGHPWRSSEALELVRRHAGADASLARHAGPERFDIANLLIVTDAELGELARVHGAPVDVRRLRPNVVIGGFPTEELDDVLDGAPGGTLAVGEALVGVLQRRGRCVVTTIDPDSGRLDLDVHRTIRRERGNLVGLDCWVIRPATVRVGDPVEFAGRLRDDVEPGRFGGWIVGARYDVG
jgi:hypothetical protein